MTPPTRRLLAEAAGTGGLVAAVVGSGTHAARLSEDVAVVLTANALATGAALFGLITVLGPVSGAHFNPVVTLVSRVRGALTTRDALAYLGAQVGGGLVGVAAANLMFDLGVWQPSTTTRGDAGVWFAEVLATVGLLAVAATGAARPVALNGALVGLWITGAYFSTSSTSFANPAVTVARSLTDTFAGIAPASVPAFVAAQLVGAVVFCAVEQVVRDRSVVDSHPSPRRRPQEEAA